MQQKICYVFLYSQSLLYRHPLKGAVSQNSAKLGNYEMPINLEKLKNNHLKP